MFPRVARMQCFTAACPKIMKRTQCLLYLNHDIAFCVPVADPDEGRRRRSIKCHVKYWARSADGALMIAGPVEGFEEDKPGRIKLREIKDQSGPPLKRFVEGATGRGTRVAADGWADCSGVENRKPVAVGTDPAHEVLDWIHRAFANLKRVGPRRSARLPEQAPGLAAHPMVLPMELAAPTRRQPEVETARTTEYPEPRSNRRKDPRSPDSPICVEPRQIFGYLSEKN